MKVESVGKRLLLLVLMTLCENTKTLNTLDVIRNKSLTI
jgi:hypothetical protein